MCVCIPDSKKKQTAVGLPPGWTFFFAEDTPRNYCKIPYVPGLYVYHPEGTRFFRSVESVVKFVPKSLELNPTAVGDFNQYIGVESVQEVGGEALENVSARSGPSPTRRKKIPASILSRRSPMSLKELLKYGCGQCINCEKDDCGRCASCVSNRSSYRQVCIQKVMLLFAQRFQFLWCQLTILRF